MDEWENILAGFLFLRHLMWIWVLKYQSFPQATLCLIIFISPFAHSSSYVQVTCVDISMRENEKSKTENYFLLSHWLKKTFRRLHLHWATGNCIKRWAAKTERKQIIFRFHQRLVQSECRGFLLFVEIISHFPQCFNPSPRVPLRRAVQTNDLRSIIEFLQFFIRRSPNLLQHKKCVNS